MFHTLHRLAIIFIWALVGGLLFCVYLKRAALSPAVDFVNALRVRSEAKPVSAGELSGQVVKVIDGDSFQLKDNQGRLFNLKLAGVEAPELTRQMPEHDLSRGRFSKTNLTQLILSKEVKVALTFMGPQQSGLGLVYLGETNVNVAVVQAGMAVVQWNYLKGLPFKEQYALLRAARKSRDANSGLWSDASELPPSAVEKN